MENEFILEDYFNRLDRKIHDIITRVSNDETTFDILDTEKSKTHKLVARKERQRLMKVGEIWQEVLGSYNGFTNLGIGHQSGLDILSNTKKIAIELKNRTNTDNASARKANLDKLAKYKKDHPEYTCIYANINADKEEKTLTGFIKTMTHDGQEIQHHVGRAFLKFVLGDDTDAIIEFVKSTIDKYT